MTMCHGGRSPHGERGLKFGLDFCIDKIASRSPHGERGLKLLHAEVYNSSSSSLPSRGAWIEIGPGSPWGPCGPVAPLTGSVD